MLPDKHKMCNKCFNDWVLQIMDQYHNRYEVYYGGGGSGKSYGAVQKIAIKAACNKRRILVVRKVASSIKDSIYLLTKSVLHELLPQLQLSFKENKSEMKLTLSNGSEFLFKGLDDPEKIKSIADISDIVIEEATELKLEDFTQLNLRLRPPEHIPCPQIYLCFNPVSKANWCYPYWFVSPPKDAMVIHTTYKDNRFLTDEYAAMLSELIQTNPSYYRIYCLGEFATLDKLVFPKYQKAIINLEQMKDYRFFIGLDFGYINDPSALVWGYVDEIGKCIFIVGEYIKKGMLNEEIYRVICDLGLSKEIIIADSAERKSIDEIKKMGIRRIAPAKKGAFSITQDIYKILGYHIVIDTRLTGILTEFENYTWKKDSGSGEYINEPIDRFNHCIDALRYGLQAVFEKREMRVLK